MKQKNYWVLADFTSKYARTQYANGNDQKRETGPKFGPTFNVLYLKTNVLRMRSRKLIAREMDIPVNIIYSMTFMIEGAEEEVQMFEFLLRRLFRFVIFF